MVNDIKGPQHTRIHGVPNHQQTGQARPKAGGVGDEAGDQSLAQSDNVKLTDTAAKLRALEVKIASQPVVDTQRVESVKKAISDGTYKINVNRTAGKMAAFESLLTNKIGEK